MRSYRTVSPLPSFRKAVCFLWHFPSRRRDRALPGMLPVWSSDFPLRLFKTESGAIAWPARSHTDSTMRVRALARRRSFRRARLALTSSPCLVQSHSVRARNDPAAYSRSRFRSSPKYSSHASTSTRFRRRCPSAGRERRVRTGRRSPSGGQTFPPASRTRRARPRSDVTTMASPGAPERGDLGDDGVVGAPAGRTPDGEAPEARTAPAGRAVEEEDRPCPGGPEPIGELGDEGLPVLLGRPRDPPDEPDQVVAVEQVRHVTPTGRVAGASAGRTGRRGRA